MTGGGKTMLTTACLVLLSGALPQDSTIEIKEMLVIEPVGTRGRVPITTNAILARIVAGIEIAPKEGDTVVLPDGGTKSWKRIKAAESGWFTSGALRGGFAYASFQSDTERVMMLEASGHDWAYVNGKPRAGDRYAFGFNRQPVLVKRGRNDLLFKVSRGRVRAKLVEPEDEVFVERHDPTLPDFMVGESGHLHGATIVTNATNVTVSGLAIFARVDGLDAVATEVGSLPPLMSRKVAFEIDVPEFTEPGSALLHVGVLIDGNGTGYSISHAIPIREAHELHKRTFVSRVDGSVQYYAVRPPFAGSLDRADGLVLTVHGAGVGATGQAAAYGSKSWAHIVAPTNRRPYGFDWEDWGRIDAMEALADAKRVFKPREDRIYLTGHSMGGHGAWYLGAMHPDQWGAIGPAAGWISFWTYGGAVRYDDPDPIEQLMIRVAGTSDITKVLRNYLHHGVFVLHGAEDGTVPISQPRQMRKYLGEFHRDVDWYEHPGGGHWYDSSPEPGADCVDYGPMFDFFDRRRRRLSHEVRTVEFHTVHPGVSATSHWMTVVAQEKPFVTSSVVATNPIGTDRFEVETVNVSRFEINVAASPVGSAQTVTVVIDGTKIETDVEEGKVRFDYSAGWSPAGAFPRGDKNPRRAGPFKAAFDNTFGFVYGTTGTPEENAWSLAKARFDAETWQYRGNGSSAIVPDTYFDDLPFQLGSNIVAYGNEDTNLVIKQVLSGSPVRVTGSSIRIGSKILEQNDLSIMMVRPLGEGNQSVAIVGGTGIKGMRSTDTMPYFVSGIHYPDVFVYDSRIHTIGSKAVRVAGVFGTDWSVANGDFAWRE